MLNIQIASTNWEKKKTSDPIKNMSEAVSWQFTIKEISMVNKLMRAYSIFGNGGSKN